MRTFFQNAAAVLERVMGDAFEPITYASRTFDAATGRATGFTETAVNAVFMDYTLRERQLLAVRPEEQHVMIRCRGFAVTPHTGDIAKRASGELWRVADKNTDPARAFWDLRVEPFAGTYPV